MVVVQFSIATFNVDLWSVWNLCRRFAATKIPVIIAFHETAREFRLLGPITQAIYRAFVRVTDVPIAFSSAGRQALVDGHLFDRVIEVPHGTSGVTEISHEACARVKTTYDVRKPLVLSLGFTDSDKGTDVLLSAAKAITTQLDGNVQFLIAGTPRVRRGIFQVMERRDRHFLERLKTTAWALMDVDIAFCDYIPDDDVAALLHVADVVALPYRKVTQSGVGNLALSCRAVLVSSDLPGLRSDLGDAAMYVAVGDANAMTRQIVDLVGESHVGARDRLRERAGLRAAANTYDRVAEVIAAAGLSFHESKS